MNSRISRGSESPVGRSVLAADEGIILRNNERTLEQILKAYAQIPPVQYSPPVERWDKLPKTGKLLTEGGTLHVVMLGDSIVNDTSRSCWNFIVERRQPKCQIEKITCVRGSTGCWWYKYPGRVQKYVLDHKPDLVIIGGISHRDDIESIREVIRQIQEAAQPDILLMTGAFGSTDPRKDFLNGRRSVCTATATTARAWRNSPARSVRRSSIWRPPGPSTFGIRAGTWPPSSGTPSTPTQQGEQILGHILANYLSYPPIAKTGGRPTRRPIRSCGTSSTGSRTGSSAS